MHRIFPFSPRLRFFGAAALLLALSAAAPAAAPQNAAAPGDAAAIAAESSDPAAALSPEQPEAAIAAEPRIRGLAAYEENDLKTAAGYLATALEINPKDAEVAGRLGFSYKELGAYEKALAVLQSAVELDGGQYFYWWWLSDTQRLLGLYDAAYKSMEHAINFAPQEMRKDLNDYLDYTARLADKTQSWENALLHGEFAERHRNNRRVRRFIAEYTVALSLAPPAQDGDREGLNGYTRAYQEMGTQYNYIEQPEVAIDYFQEARDFAAREGNLENVMRNCQSLAISHRMLHDREPEKGAAHMARATAEWREALRIARELDHSDYTRYAQGRLLESLALGGPMDSPELTALRALNDKQVPWKGPVNDFFTAEAVTGELYCRIIEGDFAGARILGGMTLPYYNESTFLSDYQRAVELQLLQALAHFRMGSVSDSLDAVKKAEEKATEARQFVETEAFNRGSGGRVLRHIAVARARAHIQKSQPTDALLALDGQRNVRLLNLLGGLLTDDSARTDTASEQEAIRQRIPWLEKRMAAFEAAGNAEEKARIEGRILQDRERLEWLGRSLDLAAPKDLKFRGIEPVEMPGVRAALPEGAVLLGCAFDPWGGVLVAAGKTATSGHLLEMNEGGAAAAVQAVLAAGSDSAAADAALDRLSTVLLAPCAELLSGASLLIVCGDETLSPLPFAALRLNGKPLVETHAVTRIESAAQLAAFMERPAQAPARLRAFLVRPDSGDLLAQKPEGAQGIVRLAGAEANMERLKADTGAGDMLHFSAMLDTSPPSPTLCPLVLGGAGNAAYLPPARVLAMNLPAAVAGLDWAPVKEGGLLRADLLSALLETFRNAGTAAVVAPLWPVGRETAELFYGTFYGALPQAGRAAALRAAQNAVRAAAPDSPDWSAFVLLGDPR